VLIEEGSFVKFVLELVEVSGFARLELNRASAQYLLLNAQIFRSEIRGKQSLKHLHPGL